MKNLFLTTLLIFSILVSGQKFHTEFEYADLPNKKITIQNSYPKGGMEYISPNGTKYEYVIFWTCITNDTDTDLEIRINFSADSFKIPSSLNVNFNLYLPMEEMTIEKELLLNYGMDLKSYLDENIGKSSELIRNISTNESHLFYTVAISNSGANGPFRAGFELENNDLIYKFNGYEMNCGKVTKQK